MLPSHKTHRGHFRLNVDAVEKYFGIQINKPAEVEEKPAIKVMHAFQQMNSYPFNTRNCIRNHAKVAIIDDKIAYMGSANATRAGLGQYKPGNFEAGILTEEAALVSSIKDLFTKVWNGDYCEGCHRAKDCVEY